MELLALSLAVPWLVTVMAGPFLPGHSCQGLVCPASTWSDFGPVSQRGVGKYRIWLVGYPPYSPDLILIKIGWNLLKKKIFELYSELASHGRREVDWTALREVVKDSWGPIDQRVLDKQISSV